MLAQIQRSCGESAVRLRRVLAREVHLDVRQPAQIKRIRLLGWLAFIGFPVFYAVWTFGFPQPYESLVLRLVAMLMCLPLLVTRDLRERKWLPAYFLFTLTYCLSFFFVYLYLMNHGNLVWSQSLVIAVIILFNFSGWVGGAASLVVGTAAAWLVYTYVTPPPAGLLEVNWPVELPIIGFTICTIAVLKIDQRILIQEKLDGMAIALGTVAHELRTPIRSIGSTALGMGRYLPGLIRFYEENETPENSLNLPRAHFGLMKDALPRIQLEVERMNHGIDVLLVNARGGADREPGEPFPLGAAVREALARYPFEAGQRERVHADLDDDFLVRAEQKLLVMVLFNLIKNALHALARAGHGEIRLRLERGPRRNRLVFRDTGTGIPERELGAIFRRFHTYPRNEGTGIGLAFCKETIEAWGGRIHCDSVEHEYTEFVLEFPPATPRREAAAAE
ncbi:sensor histidine kinase [Cupriavidus basilensis]|uniref:sensor histidine kinase n=1 Tax=Cupriavidus basilensis TaxID=68895 RepID=UPI000B2AC362|nr:HAMP domain-containing sensor histidine kinase [Cupriavidus basilensis]